MENHRIGKSACDRSHDASQKTTDLGMVSLHMISGLVIFGHAYGDKGSFILEAAGKSLLIDRGICNYNNAFASLIGNSEYHNVVIAVKDGQHLSQNKKDTKCSGIVTEVKSEVCFVLNTYGEIREEAGEFIIEDGSTKQMVSAINWQHEKRNMLSAAWTEKVDR